MKVQMMLSRARPLARIPLAAAVIAASVLLVVPLAVAAPEPQGAVPFANLAAAFNNVGITSETNTAPGNYDGAGDSYSAEALAAAGAAQGASVTHKGSAFTWPDVPAGTPDNVVTAGQVITSQGTGAALAFLGAELSTNPPAGTVTVTYTDGSTSSGTLGFPTWNKNSGVFGSEPAITMDHRNTPAGPANYGKAYYVFYNSIPLAVGKTVASVTLPQVSVMHIFAMSMVPGVPPAIGPGTPAKAMVDAAYSFKVSATGTPAPTFGVSSGALPAGLSLDPQTGIIAGTPTTVGAFSFAVTASNGFDPAATSDYTVTVAPAYQYPNFAPTPPMGWNNWSYYQCNYDQNTFLSNARALVSSGLAARGYQYVTVDDCWMAQARDASGNLVADPVRFPDGMAYVGEQLHQMGLKFGIYEDAGTVTCKHYPGSWGHFAQDAKLFASWGVDYVKLDGCNMPTLAGQTADQTSRTAYTQMSQAMLATGRPMVFSVSAPDYFRSSDALWYSVIAWSAKVGNLWREGPDIALGQYSGKWNSILKNYHYNVADPVADLQSPGRWNDPDFLLAGDWGLTTDEISSQMSLWAMMAAPLISSTDLTTLSPAARDVLGNTGIIAVDQDPLGIQGRIVEQKPTYDVLSKPLAGGDRAVAIFNTSDKAQTITTTLATAGMPAAASYALTDLNTGKTTATSGIVTANVRPHAVVIYRVHAGECKHAAPSTSITVTPLDTVNGATRYDVTMTNNGLIGAENIRLRLAVPEGWYVQPASARLNRVGPGEARTATFTVRPAVATTPGNITDTLTATATYQAGPAGSQSVSGDATVITPGLAYANLAEAFNNVGITAETDPVLGDFDGAGNSYSAEDAATAGATPGGAITHNGATFTWPDVPAGTEDNVASAGQVITQSGSGSTLAFLGANTSMTAPAGLVTLTYTDGSTSSGSLVFPNWSSGGGDQAIVMDHRNNRKGPADFGHGYYIYYASIPLTAGKTLATVTMPSLPVMHIFAMSIVG